MVLLVQLLGFARAVACFILLDQFCIFLVYIELQEKGPLNLMLHKAKWWINRRYPWFFQKKKFDETMKMKKEGNRNGQREVDRK